MADELERDCQAVEAAAQEARDAIAALLRARQTLTKAVTPLVAAHADMAWLAPLDHIATGLFGHLLANDIPDLKIATRSIFHEGSWVNSRELEPKPEHASDPIGGILTGRLRELAAQIRAGTASPDLQRWIGHREPEEPDFTPLVPSQLVYITKRFSYLDESGLPANLEISRCALALPLANLAIEKGLASIEIPRGWVESVRSAEAGPLVFARIGKAPDIGFNLKDWITAEREKSRAAWLAARERTAA